jgi:CheY-like chemotaxis protein
MKSILLVEDDEDVRGWMAMFLQLHLSGFTVTTAWNGADALQKLQDFTPDAIVFDLAMPKMDGFEFRQRQLADPRLAKIPAVALTAIYDPKDAAVKLGTLVLAKGVDTEIILHTIRTMLDSPNSQMH